MNKTKYFDFEKNQYLSHTFRRRSVIHISWKNSKNGLKMIVERYEDKKQHLTFAIQYKYRKIECCSTRIEWSGSLAKWFYSLPKQ
jgi:hypothetical protein